VAALHDSLSKNETVGNKRKRQKINFNSL
jgi:hypothetical protein